MGRPSFETPAARLLRMRAEVTPQRKKAGQATGQPAFVVMLYRSDDLPQRNRQSAQVGIHHQSGLPVAQLEDGTLFIGQ